MGEHVWVRGVVALRGGIFLALRRFSPPRDYILCLSAGGGGVASLGFPLTAYRGLFGLGSRGVVILMSLFH